MGGAKSPRTNRLEPPPAAAVVVRSLRAWRRPWRSAHGTGVRRRTLGQRGEADRRRIIVVVVVLGRFEVHRRANGHERLDHALGPFGGIYEPDADAQRSF